MTAVVELYDIRFGQRSQGFFDLPGNGSLGCRSVEGILPEIAHHTGEWTFTVCKKNRVYSFYFPIRLPFRFVEERSEEHTSELQSRGQLACRLLLEKK